ncbi:MAG TPA: transposase [Gammaproteobacteria bacterium]|nr:transposase [Gammaproteobacteria bacterium]
MTYDALRKGRASVPGHAYVVTTVTSRRMRLFVDLRAARAVIREMHRLEATGAIHSLAWVLMPDHLHWLFQLTDDRQHEADLATIMKLFKGRSARAVNHVMRRRGAVWQRAYYDRGVRNDEDVVQIARYIAANPLRARLVRTLGEYPHWDAIWL